MTYDGIVLAGGAGRRLGGTSKPMLVVGGSPMLATALEALAGARTTVAVGPVVRTSHRVSWVRETPSGGGPVAAIAAAAGLVADQVVVLAADLPFVTVEAVEALVAARGSHAAVLAVDDAGRDQPLLGCYDVAALRLALPAEPSGASMRAVITAIEAAGPIMRVALGGNPPVWWDCDTPDDLRRANDDR